MAIVIKQGKDLNKKEIDVINEVNFREWKLPEEFQANLEKHIHVFVKDNNDKILAKGQLYKLPDVRFNNDHFDLIEIGGIIAIEKGKGYGKELMEGISNYLYENNKSGIGFTSKANSGFYQKCKFSIDFTSLPRFINYQKLTGSDKEEAIFYLDSDDKFMEKVLSVPNKNVYLFNGAK